MVKEIINIGIGAPGINIVDTIFSQLALEHNVTHDGCQTSDKSMENSDDLKSTVFSETKEGKFVPRCLFFDADSCPMEKVKTGPKKEFYNKNNYVHGKESSASLCSKAMNYFRYQLKDTILDQVRREVEKCDSFDAFNIHGSLCGGSAGLILELSKYLSKDYTKKNLIHFTEWPSPNQSSVIVDVHNFELTFSALAKYTNYNVFWHNEKLYDIFNQKFGVYSSSYEHINYLLALAYSDFTSPMRFQGKGLSSFNKMVTDLVCYPRLKHSSYQMAPMCEPEDMILENHDIDDLFDSCFDSDNKFFCTSNNEELQLTEKEITTSINNKLGSLFTFRGNFTPKDFSESIYASEFYSKSIFNINSKITQQTNALNTNQCLVNRSILEKYKSTIGQHNRNLLINKTGDGVSECLTNIDKKFQKHYNKRAFMVYFLGEGMERGAYPESMQNLKFFIKDYNEATKISQEEDEEV